MEYLEINWNKNLTNYPEAKTRLGIKDRNYGKSNDRSDTFVVTMHEKAITDLAHLKTNFDYRKLSIQKKISYDFYKQLLESSIEVF